MERSESETHDNSGIRVNGGMAAGHRILVATDFAEPADRALDWAIMLARSTMGQVFLVNVIECAGHVATLAARDAAGLGLSERERRVREAGLTVRSWYRAGRPDEIVAEVAAEINADLVVIGNLGGGARRGLMGSTADRIVRSSYRPVVTVPFTDGPIEPVQHVLVGTDFSAESRAALETAVSFVGERPEVLLLHAWYPSTMFGAGAVDEVLTIPQGDEGDAVREDLDALAKPMRDHGVTIETLACPGYPASVIHDEAQERAVDLIALGTHGRSGLGHFMLGSIAERVLHRAPCPVLTVRRHDAGTTLARHAESRE